MTIVPNNWMSVIKKSAGGRYYFGDFFIFGESFSQFKKVEPFIRGFKRIK